MILKRYITTYYHIKMNHQYFVMINQKVKYINGAEEITFLVERDRFM